MTDPFQSSWHYHTMYGLQNELIWEGQYDLYPLWKCFGIPENLTSQSVIDIGTASGFFAFECEKRGASRVVATELKNIENWDARCFVDYAGVKIPEENQRDFQELHRLFRSKVELHWGSINDKANAALGTFDLVIFGSLMTHLRDVVLALENVRLLTKKRAVIISSYLPDDPNPSLHWIQTDRPFDWWVPTKSLVPKMLRAVGFQRVEEIGDFVLIHKNGTKQRQACWHAFP